MKVNIYERMKDLAAHDPAEIRLEQSLYDEYRRWLRVGDYGGQPAGAVLLFNGIPVRLIPS